MKRLLLAALTLCVLGSCATTKKQGCNTLVYNHQITENGDVLVHNTGKVGSTVITDDAVIIDNYRYNILQKEANVYFCEDRKHNRATIHVFDGQYTKTVSVYTRHINKYYLLFSEQDYDNVASIKH